MCNEKHTELIQRYTRQLTEILCKKIKLEARTFGFEYEFLPRNPITADHVNQLKAFLLTRGLTLNELGCIAAPSGLYISFEPGGQIEYSSPPMCAGETSVFQETLTLIRHTNAVIREHFGIEYLATGYLPGRGDAPMCLTSGRYQSLHARMQKCGTKGREMMKGTASVHLHVSFHNIREILPLFRKLAEISSAEEFRMSSDRLDIWDNTDTGRYKLRHDFLNIGDSEQVIESFVRFALKAEDIYTDIPFWQTRNNSFDTFLEHLTTIYTNVRLNLKGPTLELRTLDSLPVSEFERKWKNFVSLFEDF